MNHAVLIVNLLISILHKHPPLPQPNILDIKHINPIKNGLILQMALDLFVGSGEAESYEVWALVQDQGLLFDGVEGIHVVLFNLYL